MPEPDLRAYESWRTGQKPAFRCMFIQLAHFLERNQMILVPFGDEIDLPGSTAIEAWITPTASIGVLMHPMGRRLGVLKRKKQPKPQYSHSADAWD